MTPEQFDRQRELAGNIVCEAALEGGSSTSERPDVAAEVRRWVEKAEADLSGAECLLTMGTLCPFDVICFHSQQCVEKGVSIGRL